MVVSITATVLQEKLRHDAAVMTVRDKDHAGDVVLMPTAAEHLCCFIKDGANVGRAIGCFDGFHR